MKLISKYVWLKRLGQWLKRLWQWHTWKLPWSWAAVGVLVLLVGALVQPWLSVPFPYTHDGENHLARFMNTATAIRQGQIPPRFAPDILSGYGYPVLHYNYPLANLLAVPLVWIKIHPAVIMGLQLAMALLLASLAWWFLMRRWWSATATAGSILAFLTSSYVVTAMLWRGSIGEVWAMALVPVIAWLSVRYLERPSLLGWWGIVASLTAFGLSHNVLVAMLAPWIGLTLLWWAWQKRHVWSISLAGVVAIGLTLWFWLPAITELSLVVLQQESLANQAADHLLGWNQLWLSQLRFGFSFMGPLDSLGLGLGIVSLILAMLILGRLIQVGISQRRWGAGPIATLVLVVSVLSLVMAWEGSRGIWQLIPALSIIQFPMRWLALVTLGLAAGTGWLLHQLEGYKGWQLLVGLMLVMQSAMMFGLAPVDRINQPAAYYRFFPHSTLTRNENRPVTLVATVLPSWQAVPTVATGEAEITVQTWNGSRRQYQVFAKTDAVIVEPTVYFPGWRVRVNGADVEVDTEVAEGLLAYALPASDSPVTVTTAFVQRTPARLIGESLTVGTAGIALLASGAIWWKQRRSQS